MSWRKKQSRGVTERQRDATEIDERRDLIPAGIENRAGGWIIVEAAGHICRGLKLRAA